MRLADLTWGEVKEYLSKGNNHLIIPVGTCEQHGDHLPLNNDTLVTEIMAQELSEQTGVLVAPALNYGVNLPCDRLLSGTTTITPEILNSTILAITEWWRDQGFQLFILMTYHGDPFHIEAMSSLGRDIALLELGNIDYSDILEKQATIRHSCEAETSVALCLYPEKVRLDRIKEHDIPFERFRDYLFHINCNQPPNYVGCLGFPSYATTEKGNEIVRRTIAKMLSDYQEIVAKYTAGNDPGGK